MDIPIQRRRRVRPYAYGGVALAAVALLVTGVSRMREAAPRVSRSAVWIDTVRQGELVRDVSGPGRLETEAVRIVSARSAGRVEQIHCEPGAAVVAETVVLELSNPELEQQSLEAAAEVKHAEAELLDLRATLQIQIIEQRAVLESLRAERGQAARQARVQEHLAVNQLAAPNAVLDAAERAQELSARFDFEQEHLGVLSSAWKARVAAKGAELERLRAQAELRQRQVQELKVRAGTDGVLQDLPLEVGQQVELGMQLAKVVDPTRLRAELRIPEARGKEVAVGQRVSVDIQRELVPGHVIHVDPAVQDGSVIVEVAFDGKLPQGARPDLSIDGRVEIERLPNVLHVGKPAGGGSNSNIALFKLRPDSGFADRVSVRFGRSSASAIEVLAGLRQGDRVILSDMSEWDHSAQIELE
jgi:HlyD family secretion protein